jgi:hypothetical protein
MHAERQLDRFSHKWEGNIKIKFREIEFKEIDWIELVQDRVQ